MELERRARGRRRAHIEQGEKIGRLREGKSQHVFAPTYLVISYSSWNSDLQKRTFPRVTTRPEYFSELLRKS